MSDVFLYLLGAGASCQVLPLASDFSDRLRAFSHDLRRAGTQDEVYTEPNLILMIQSGVDLA